MKAFEALPVKDKLAVAKRIQLNISDELFEELDAEMPDVEMSSEEIQAEINAYRNAKRKED
ncbi:hypothetical protein [Persicitalea sp.]|uniref:hypothetical protein n=1 Tax=Persicitalea sp. TaxID=3100273 RepID=UPI0035947E57